MSVRSESFLFLFVQLLQTHSACVAPRRPSALRAVMVDSPPVTHAASWGARSLSVQSPGTLSAVNHSMRLSGGTRGGTYRSGMPPLEDISARWRRSENAKTDCWPTPREENAKSHSLNGTWGHICGFFYNESRSLPTNSQPPTVPTFPAPSPRAAAEKPLAPVPYTGRVVLTLMPPGPASPRFMMPDIVAQVNVPGAATPTGRPLQPRYLNNLPPKDRFDHLPPPWGPALTADADKIARRWPTIAG